MNVKIDGLSAAQKRMKNRASQTKALLGTVILIFDLIMLLRRPLSTKRQH